MTSSFSLHTVTQFAEAVEDLSEAVVHGRQRLQLDLLEVFGTLVLQVTISLADAAYDSWRLEQENTCPGTIRHVGLHQTRISVR